MNIVNAKINFSTQGNNQIVDITEQVKNELKKSKLLSGIATIFAPGATGAITTMEYEPGLVKDSQKFINQLVDDKGQFNHDSGNPKGNAPAHIRAFLFGPSITVPFENAGFQLGTWQQIVFIDFDNRPRNREIIIKFLGN
ncbi:MAG: secondary thiamine-phosphate synthase enzyme YjbQ [Elusimicrobia bacterium]|nr:secondary thiamine-phosphate synthase enzyme YjbQ [Elusimicrobiota bacterium]MBU2614320.1 secondary thiamine-phosphate synthase enzyme YjbQ [Elusimicrobiota bacterium]